MTRPEAEQLLRRAINEPSATFRPGQWEAIDALANHRRKLLVVERTGWGKSLVYFIGTRILRQKGFGVTLIVSPLLALMRNQLEAARRIGVRAETINSTNTEDWDRIQREVRLDQVDALLISPERLANEKFVNNLLLPLADRIGLVVVDEAHCISDWGHDFRPDYRRLVSILKYLPPNTPLLGTTATANDRVIEDVQGQLGDIRVQRGPLMRKSLQLQTIRLKDQSERLAWLAHNLPHLPGTGIVYTLTTRDAEQVARWLQQNGIRAEAYHSNVKHDGHADTNAYREYLEGLLLNNKLKALVATTALGMGYDKPDLGFVVHYQAPGSIVAYYQQVGRAGRAIDRAYGILLAGQEDADIQDYFRTSAFPKESEVLEILSVLEDHDGLSIRQLEGFLNLRYGQIQKVLKLLSVESRSPILKDRSKWFRTPLPYQMDHERIEHLTRQRELEWQEVQDYIDSSSCLMEYLGRKLDDPQAGPCGQCAVCLGRPLVPVTAPEPLVVQAARFLRRSEIPIKPKKQVAADAFPVYGFRANLPTDLRAEEGRVLSRWGDAGWGAKVAEDKHNGHFREELIAALAEMIRERWQPQPAPSWITYVPSLRHTRLVPELAAGLARKLDLPLLPAVQKLKQNQPQKMQQNRFHQCHNLDGAFGIRGDIPSGPVLLVDDIIDSGWTLTVVAALLRQAGSGPVYPVALASTQPNQ